MQKRELGSTGIDVSVLGLGTVKFGRNEGVKYPNAFDLPSDKEIKNLLALATDLGINLIDTAPAYGISEERLGKLLSTRQEWVLVTKAGEEFVDGESRFDFSAIAIRMSVERSLKRLKTDYLDLVLAHSNGEDLRIINNDQVFDTFERLKHEGKIRAYGMSTKTVEGGLETIKRADVAMVTFNQADMQDKVIIDAAVEMKKGILVKKAFGSGHLEVNNKKISAEEALQFVLAERGVNSVMVGTINEAHLRANARCCSSS